ncbi:tyrosine-type recombinase/integrase [Magnetospirillum molischianum]|uniref:Tyr recombinase domain-containing protein n=1 Tax=Magnetospirillum molischianum DSM 120 TaxID=1150626 RepID=H8FXA8_MAGML|nr:tyrosine-type recombinase/integrase [Magnetospirillum molischianum]CCG42996.1 conserved hypothetical protein [Magnetospirillum molischianum DSM 120]
MFDPIKILDGAVTLYQRTSNGARTWTARYKIKGAKGYVVAATGKRDLEEAKEVARERFYELTADHRRGIAIHSRTFSKAVEAYLEDQQVAFTTGKITERTMRDNKATIDRYLLPYFKGRAIEAIHQEHIEAYKLWRLTYWTTGPGAEQTTREYVRGGKLIRAKRPPKAQTKRSGEILVLKAIFASAVRRKWLKREQVPEITEERSDDNRRPAFTPADWQRIKAAMPAFIASANGPVVTVDRKMLCGYMEFMFETGLRPGKEHQQLTWADCQLVVGQGPSGPTKETHIHVREDTKTGKRTAVSSEETWLVLQRIRGFSRWIELGDPVFADQKTGKAIKCFSKGMSALLKQVGLERDRHGDKFSPYSLRHSYATDRLINAQVDVWLLAKNMGTSVEMIRKHYGQDEPQQRAMELIHDKRRMTFGEMLKADPDSLPDPDFEMAADDQPAAPPRSSAKPQGVSLSEVIAQRKGPPRNE